MPFIDLQRREEGFLERCVERVTDVSANTRCVGRPDVARLEARFAEEAEVPAIVVCANGTDALSLRAVGVCEGDRVLIPEVTFWATVEAAMRETDAATTEAIP